MASTQTRQADAVEPALPGHWHRPLGGAPKALREETRFAESSLRLVGMHCGACAGVIEQALARLPGVVQARVSAAAQCATVRWNPAVTRASLLVRAVELAGYQALPDTAAAARAQRRREARSALWRLFVAGFCAMQVMMLAAPAYFSAPGDLAPDHKRLLDWAAWLLTLPVLCFAAAPFFSGAWRALRQRRIGMDVPVALGLAVAFVASSGAAFDPGGIFGHEVWFDSLTMFVSFLLAGRWLEMRLRHRAEAELEDAGLLPETALRVAVDGLVETVGVASLRPGDCVRVPVGQAFAADGVLIDGNTAADESLLTGEARPLAKAPGAVLVAGSINIGAPVLMRVDRVGADTRCEAIVALMRAARSDRPALLASADRWAAPFLYSVLLLAAAAGAVWSVVDPARAWWVVVSVLVVTCPCALSLAAPSALLAAAARLGRQGLLLRRLDAIAGLARITTLFVDKTGTLTEGKLVVVRAQRLDGLAGMDGSAPDGAGPDADAPDDAALAGIAASLAAWSNHPLAQALRALPAAPGLAWHGVQEVPGAGLEALDAAGRRWRLGSAAWSGAQAGSQEGNPDRPATWLACNGRALMRFDNDERIRDGAAAAVRALQADGVRVVLLSGDDSARVRRVADALGIADAAGGLSPEAKLAVLRCAQQRGEIVAMLGDGINDAPVLARADVSVAMGEGASIARCQADAVLVSNRLLDLVQARRLARRALRVVHQNFAWAALYNAVCVPLALAGALPPWAAGLGMACSSLGVVLNSLRLASVTH